MKSITYLIGLGSLLLQTNVEARVNSPKNPNIIFILADDLGYGDISCMNERGKIHPPNIDHILNYNR